MKNCKLFLLTAASFIFLVFSAAVNAAAEKSVPDYTMVKGVPAKKVMEYEVLMSE